MLNLEWFRTFKAIYETGNLSNAAQALFISQPGVSLHLNSLEAYTGNRLFDRETRKMIPTDQGTILYNCIADSVNKLVEVEYLFCRNAVTGKPTLSVGLGVEAFEYILAEHIAELPFNLIVRCGEGPQLLHDLISGTLDLVLTSQAHPQPNLEYTSFAKERIVLVCGARTNTEELDQLIDANKRIAIKEWLKQQVWYTAAADNGHLKSFWLTNFDCQPDFIPNYILPNVGAMLRCIRNGKGFAVMPDFLCKTALDSRTVRLAWEEMPTIENTLYFVKQKRTRHAARIRQLQDILTKNWFLHTQSRVKSAVLV